MRFNPNQASQSFFKKELVQFYFSQLEEVRDRRLAYPTTDIEEFILSLRTEILWLNQLANECIRYRNDTQEM